MRLLVLVTVGSLLVAACSTQAGDGQRAPTAPAISDPADASAGLPESPASGVPGDHDSDGPPDAFIVRKDGERFRGARGTYCWTRACVDYIAPVSNVEPIPLDGGETITIEYAGLAADVHRIQWHPVEQTPRNEHGEQLVWSGREVGKRDSVADSTTTPTDAGLYLVTVFAQWEPWGDAFYGFLVEVR